MEKQDAAIDSRLPAFICATMSSRSVLLMLFINSTYLKKESPSSVSTGDQALFTQRWSPKISFVIIGDSGLCRGEQKAVLLLCAPFVCAKLIKIERIMPKSYIK